MVDKFPTGRDLDVALAEALGWQRGNDEWIEPNRDPADDRNWQWLPSWHASLDAVMRDVWPVLRERGWKWFCLEFTDFGGYESASCEIGYESHEVNALSHRTSEEEERPVFAEAFCRAALRALREGSHE